MDYNAMFGGYPQMSPYYANLYGQRQQPTQTNVLPPQQVIQVDGRASIDTLQMSPNSSILIMDKSQPIVWLCVSDGLGKVTASAYDITPHQDIPPVDVNALEQRISALETMLTALTEVNNDESDASSTNGEKSANTNTPSRSEHIKYKTNH